MACVILVPSPGMELKPPMSEVQSLNHWEVLQKLVFKKKKYKQRISLVVQWLRLHAPNSKGPGLVPAQETRSHMSHS